MVASILVAQHVWHVKITALILVIAHVVEDVTVIVSANARLLVGKNVLILVNLNASTHVHRKAQICHSILQIKRIITLIHLQAVVLIVLVHVLLAVKMVVKGIVKVVAPVVAILVVKKHVTKAVPEVAIRVAREIVKVVAQGLAKPGAQVAPGVVLEGAIRLVMVDVR